MECGNSVLAGLLEGDTPLGRVTLQLRNTSARSTLMRKDGKVVELGAYAYPTGKLTDVRPLGLVQAGALGLGGGAWGASPAHGCSRLADCLADASAP